MHRALLGLGLGLGVALCVLHSAFGAPPQDHPDPTARPTVPAAIFGVGFTNLTEKSARLVFTTSEPMSTSVDIFDNKTSILHREQSSLDEIHAVSLTGLTSGKSYRVLIKGTGKSGALATDTATLLPAPHPARKHPWPGYTIFGSTVTAGTTENLDLLEQSGARMARIEPSWDGVFPKKGQLNRAFLDRMVRYAQELKKRGIEPLVILDYCVAWAKPHTATTMTWRNVNFGPPDQLADWNEYVRTVVKAMLGTARYYEVWNEPDAGYLATGSFVERPNVPVPIGRLPYKDNTDYWIGDRYAPLVHEVRKVVDELEPNAIVMNGGWNRDYTGTRGDLLLQRGMASDADLYAYHVYSHSPTSFGRWYKEVDGGFRANIDRIFAKNHVTMPLAVTEWGTPAYATSQPGKGFVSYQDSELFYLKSTFYFLSMERFELLSQFALGTGPSARDRDPLFFMLVNEDTKNDPIVTPTFETFQWLATTFGSRPYRAIPVTFTGAPQAKAYAVQLKDTGDIYLAAWQDGAVNDNGIVTPEQPRTITASLGSVDYGKYNISALDNDGKPVSGLATAIISPTQLSISLPGATTTAESQVFLARLSPIEH